MAAPSTSYLSLGLAILILFHPTLLNAQLEQVASRPSIHGQGQQQRQPRHPQAQRRGEECRIDRLDALEPTRRIEAEAGVTELWDENHEQLECAGAAVQRHIIQRRGLFLPAFTNAPEILYVVQGRGLHGAALPGCPETFEEQQSQESQSRFREGSERFRGDGHQKVRRIREGDIIALAAGATHWIYNDDQTELVIVSMVHLNNQANQLDQNFRKFFLAGNPNQLEGQQGRRGGRWSSLSERRIRGEGQQQEESFGNLFAGFDSRFLSEAFNIDDDLARRLQCRQDNRGHIVEVQNELDIVHPEYREREEEREMEREREWEGSQRRRRFPWGMRGERWGNGIEETICTAKLRENINNPTRADVFNPRGGRFTTLNGFNLPILQFLQLSAERVVLYQDALVTPHYYMNCHGVIYCTRGNGRLQVVNEEGENVFDGELQEGQLIVVPQGHAVVKKAGQQGFDYISFRTNDQAMISPLAGRLSVLRGLPDDVVMNAYEMSRDEARELKYNREELTVLSPQEGRGLSRRD